MLDRMFENYAEQYRDLPLEFSICDDGDPVPARIPLDWFPMEPWAQYVTLERLPRKNHALNPCVPINVAVNMCGGEIIVLTNAEIYHPAPVLQEMLSLLRDRKDYIVARCKREKRNVWLTGPDINTHGREATPPGGYFHFLTMFHRRLWDAAGGFDEDYRYGQACDDNDWLWRLYAAGANFKVTEGHVIHLEGPRVHWNMPHNRTLFNKKWPAQRRQALIEARKNGDIRLCNAGTANGGTGGGAAENRGRGVCGGTSGDAELRRREECRDIQNDGVVAIPRDIEHAGVGSAVGNKHIGHAASTEPRPNVVERVVRVTRPQQNSRARRKEQHKLNASGAGSATPSEVLLRSKGRRRGLVHPEWALILGGGAGVWDEVLELENNIYRKQWDGLVVAANDVGCHWPRDLDHWASLHPDKFQAWEELRARYGFSQTYEKWGRKARFGGRTVVPWAGGSSGMLAVQVAQTVGALRVVLCGIPMTETPHFEESVIHDDRPWKACAGHWRAWEKHIGKMHGWVRSMSGRTLELLGRPTLEWLREGVAD